MNLTIVIFFLAVLFFAFVVFRSATKKRTSESERIKSWGMSNDVDIILMEKKALFKGPFSFQINPGGSVFRIVVRCNEDERKEGWLCLHSAILFGQDWEEVKWKKQSRAKR